MRTPEAQSTLITAEASTLATGEYQCSDRIPLRLAQGRPPGWVLL